MTTTESLLADAIKLLRRYRNETPLGHQPSMIAHLADDVLAQHDHSAKAEAGLRERCEALVRMWKKIAEGQPWSMQCARELEAALRGDQCLKLAKALAYQEQVDEDGVLIGVSRQAVDETVQLLTQLAASPAPAEEEGAHGAICDAVSLMNQGKTLDAHDLLRRFLVDYADAATRPETMDKGPCFRVRCQLGKQCIDDGLCFRTGELI
jgi:hypothetical protein